jgi:predicted transcriptional regulator
MPSFATFDDLSATMRVTLFLYKHPNSNISDIMAGTDVGQKAVYSARDFLEQNKLLSSQKKAGLPYNLEYSLNEKGKKIGEHLEEIQKLLEQER